MWACRSLRGQSERNGILWSVLQRLSPKRPDVLPNYRQAVLPRELHSLPPLYRVCVFLKEVTTKTPYRSLLRGAWYHDSTGASLGHPSNLTAFVREELQESTIAALYLAMLPKVVVGMDWSGRATGIV
jgi:hypothetical protein